MEVETGKTSDQKMAIPMIEAARENLGENNEDRMKTVAMDKGFDSEENVREANKRGVHAIVPVREVPDNLEKLSKEDREEPLLPGGNVVYDRYSGEVACYESPENKKEDPTRRTMTYAGYEADRSSHKFRCPLGAYAQAACTSFESCGTSLEWACGTSSVRGSPPWQSWQFTPLRKWTSPTRLSAGTNR